MFQVAITYYFRQRDFEGRKNIRKVLKATQMKITQIQNLFTMLVSFNKTILFILVHFKTCFFNIRDSRNVFSFPADGQPLYNANHTISLAMEGREVPRRKPGRPRKPKLTEVEVEVLITDDLSKTNEEQTMVSDDIVDPEQALELMFKEAEEKRLTSGELSRLRRRRRLPQRFFPTTYLSICCFNLTFSSVLSYFADFLVKCRVKSWRKF